MISIEKGKKEILGHCLGCHDNTLIMVYEIQFDDGGGSMVSIRLCNSCKDELLKKLKRQNDYPNN